MAQTQLRTQIVINVTVPQGANLGPYIQQVQQLQQTLGTAAPTIININNQTRAWSATTRRLLLDLRMFSFAMRTLRREFGVTSPIVEAATRGLIVISAVATGAVAGFDMLRRIQTMLTGSTVGLSAAMASLKAGAAGLMAVLSALWPVLVVLASVIGGIKLFEWLTGIQGVQSAMKQWKKDVEDLNASLKDLRYEQSLVSEEMQYYQYWLDNVEYAEEKMGYATEEMTRMQGYLNQQLKSSQRDLSALTWEMTTVTNRAAGLERATEDAQEAIQRHRRGALGALVNPQFWLSFPQNVMGGLGMLGGMLGGGREQVPRNVTPAGGGGLVQVQISFPNATFHTQEDVEAALERGGEAAGQRLEYLRRGLRP
jgi:hypothetical protein